MNKLAQIRKALQGNPNITIVGFKGPDGNHSYSGMDLIAKFYIAPRNGGVYVTEELRALKRTLFPNLQPTSNNDYSEGDLSMSFGTVTFFEDVAEEIIRTEVTLLDDSAFSSEGFIDGKRIEKERKKKIQRRILVTLYPSTQIATEALEGKNEYFINQNELAKHRGIVARLVSAIS